MTGLQPMPHRLEARALVDRIEALIQVDVGRNIDALFEAA